MRRRARGRLPATGPSGAPKTLAKRWSSSDVTVSSSETARAAIVELPQVEAGGDGAVEQVIDGRVDRHGVEEIVVSEREAGGLGRHRRGDGPAG